MSDPTTGPALNATGSDPLSSMPAAPPVNASNDPADRAAGSVGEMSATDQAALVRARSGADQIEAPKPAEAPAPTEAPKPGEPPVDENADDKILKDDKTPPWMKAEITKERNKRREADTARETALATAAASQKRLDEALEALKALAPKPAPEPIAAPRPKRADFNDPDAYDAALDTWATDAAAAAATKATADGERKAAEAREAALNEAREASLAAQLESLKTTYEAKRAEALVKYPDFEAVTEADNLPIDYPTAHAMIAAANGPDIAYHLGKNPAEAARISKLSPALQVFEVGMLSAKLASTPPVRVSNAPAPITPLQASREPASNANREESMEEVANRVRNQATNGRTPMWGSRA